MRYLLDAVAFLAQQAAKVCLVGFGVPGPAITDFPLLTDSQEGLAG